MDRTIKINKQQLELIEKFGVFMERNGNSPAESRIIALLLVSDIPELTFEEIYQTLQISKSAASNSINRLLNLDQIDYITKPGDRKRYFRSTMPLWEERFQRSFDRIFKMSELMQEVIDQKPKSDKEMKKNMQDFVHFMTFLQTELPLLYKKWKVKNR